MYSAGHQTREVRMKRSLEFRTKIMRVAMNSLDAEDRAVLTAVLDEIDAGDLNSETHTLLSSGTIVRWDICFLSIFNEGFYIKHWTREVGDLGMPKANIHAAARRLAKQPSSGMAARRLLETLTDILERSAFGTIALLAVGQTAEGKRLETFWWHPSMQKEEAATAFRGIVEYALEEKS